jgi:hypothetical protein
MTDVPPELTQAITDAVLAAAKGNAEGLRDALHQAADVDFPAGISYACYAWARVAAAATLGSADALDEYAAKGTYAGVQFRDDNGDPANAEDVSPVTRFVGRMIACAFNDDHRAAMDLWIALDDDIWADCCIAMASAAGEAVVGRAKRDLGIA